MEEKRYLTFALGKGRLAKKTLELFEKIGITCDEIRDPDTRKLIFVNEELGLRFFLAKGPDVRQRFLRLQFPGYNLIFDLVYDLLVNGICPMRFNNNYHVFSFIASS